MKIKENKEPKTLLGKIWHFLWKEDSLLSWIVSLVLAFIIVKFIFFPLLSLFFATSMPLVVVESESMHHPGSFIGNVIGLEDSFELWWESKGVWYAGKAIDREQAEQWPLRNGLERGDIVVVVGHGNISVGDIIVFEADQKHPLIHRVVEVREDEGGKMYETKGDNNSGQLIHEKSIPESAIVGKAIMRIPKLGWIKLAFVKIFQAFS